MPNNLNVSPLTNSLFNPTIPLPPGPTGLALIFSKLEVAFDPLGSLVKCARKYGDIIRLDQNSYLVNHPDYIEQVFANTNGAFLYNIYKGIESAATRFWGQGLPVNQGESWLRQRRFVQQAFHRNHLAAYSQVMIDCTTRMLETWGDGEIRNVRRELMRLSLEIAAKVVLDLERCVELDEIEAALQATLRLLDNPPQLDVAIPTRDKKCFRETVDRLDEIIYGLIQQRRIDGQNRGDVLSLLLAAQDEDGYRMTNQQLRDEVVTLLRASHKNTPTVLLWVWYLLSQHPKAEANLVAELNQVLGDRLPTLADLPNLRYVETVLKETMRLYPLYPLVSREVVQDAEFGGYYIPSGAQIMVSAWLMHRDPRYFEQPELFNPERWADHLEKRLPKYTYFPFGGGPRLCVVKAYAMMEATLLVATIAQQFRLTSVPGYRLKLFDAFSGLRPKNDLRMILTRRQRFT